MMAVMMKWYKEDIKICFMLLLNHFTLYLLILLLKFVVLVFVSLAYFYYSALLCYDILIKSVNKILSWNLYIYSFYLHFNYGYM